MFVYNKIIQILIKNTLYKAPLVAILEFTALHFKKRKTLSSNLKIDHLTQILKIHINHKHTLYRIKNFIERNFNFTFKFEQRNNNKFLNLTVLWKFDSDRDVFSQDGDNTRGSYHSHFDTGWYILWHAHCGGHFVKWYNFS